jgi:hypothetical protein
MFEIMSQNKSFLPYIVSVKYFVTETRKVTKTCFLIYIMHKYVHMNIIDLTCHVTSVLIIHDEL